MKIFDIRERVFSELDSRNLAQPARRKTALEHVLVFVARSKYCRNEDVILPCSKNQFKQDYESHKNHAMNGAEKSVINEMYKLYES